MECAPLIGYDQLQRKIRDRLGGKMGREGLESGARQGAPGNNFKLNTRRNLTGGTARCRRRYRDGRARRAGRGAIDERPLGACPAPAGGRGRRRYRTHRAVRPPHGGGQRPLAARGARHDDDAVRARRGLAAAGSVRVIPARSRPAAARLDARAGAADVRSGGGSRGGGSARRHLLRRRRALGSVGRRRDVRRCGVRAVGLADRAPAIIRSRSRSV